MDAKRERIGQMRHRVVIQQYSAARNSHGEEILTWSTLATVWAEVLQTTGGSDEGEQAKRQTAKTAAVFRMYYRAGLNEKMRLFWGGKVWNIRSIIPDNLLQYMVLEAEYELT